MMPLSNGESSQPEVSDQSQADRFHQWCQLSLCLHHFLPRNSEEHRQQRDLSGGLKGEWSCSEMCHFILAKFKTKRSAGPKQCRETCWIPVGFLKYHHHCEILVKFQKIWSGPRRIWERFARPRHLYQKTWAEVFQSLLRKPYLQTEFHFVFSFLGFFQSSTF